MQRDKFASIINANYNRYMNFYNSENMKIESYLIEKFEFLSRNQNS